MGERGLVEMKKNGDGMELVVWKKLGEDRGYKGERGWVR